MRLGDKQRVFSRKIAVLIQVAYEMGYEISLARGSVSKEANQADGGHNRSLHLSKLAQDLNLFKDGKYLSDGTGHHELHDVWDLMGGAERIANDLNHYSMAHNGMR